MFMGSIPGPMRQYVAECVRSWSTDTLYVGCSGNFTIERCLPGLKHHGNDVTLYSSVLGWWAARDDTLDQVTLNDDAHELLPWLAPAFDTPEGKVAVTMLGTRFLNSVGRDNDFHRRNVQSYRDQWDTVYQKTLAKVQASPLRLDTYYAGDVREWLDTHVPKDGSVAMFPPFFCLQEDERILTDDLRWVRVGDLEPGDGILAFEEEPQPGTRCRRWQFGTVLRSDSAVAPCYRVDLTDGTSIVTTGNHPWLAHVNPTEGAKGGWVQTTDLLPGKHYVNRLLETWEPANTRDAGWLAGIFDGEGSIHLNRSTTKLAASQKPGPVADEIILQIKAHGFDSGSFLRPNDVLGIEVAGGMPEVLRFLGTIRPDRMIRNLQFTQNIGLRSTRSRQASITARVGVQSVAYVGEQRIQQVTTSTGTYIGEGFAMHNSGDYEQMFAALDKFIDWPAPTYPELDEAGKDAMVNQIIDRPQWMIGLHQERPDLHPHLKGKVQTTNRGVPIYLYASHGSPRRVVAPKQPLEHVLTSRLDPTSELTGHEKIALAPLTGGQFSTLRSQYMNHTIKPGSPLMALAVLIDGKIAGCIAFNPPDSKFDPHSAYLLSDFPVVPTRYKRLAALIVRCAQSTEAQRLLERSLSRRVNWIETTAFSNNPSSMKYRTGQMKCLSRKPGTDGHHKHMLQYGAEAGRWSLAEGFRQWFESQGQHVETVDA